MLSLWLFPVVYLFYWSFFPFGDCRKTFWWKFQMKINTSMGWCVCVCVDFQWKLNSLIIKNLQKLSIAFCILWHQLIVLKSFCNFFIFSLKRHVFRTEIRGHCILMHKIVIKSNGILQNHGALWRCNLLNFLL